MASQFGKIVTFNSDKGYGFIKRQGKRDLYIHISALKGPKLLSKGDEVTFDEVSGERGNRAANVKVVQRFDQANWSPNTRE